MSKADERALSITARSPRPALVANTVAAHREATRQAPSTQRSSPSTPSSSSSTGKRRASPLLHRRRGRRPRGRVRKHHEGRPRPRTGESSPLLLRAHGTVHARAAAVLDDLTAPTRPHRAALQTAQRAVELALDSIMLVHFHAMLTFNAACSGSATSARQRRLRGAGRRRPRPAGRRWTFRQFRLTTWTLLSTTHFRLPTSCQPWCTPGVLGIVTACRPPLQHLYWLGAAESCVHGSQSTQTMATT